jgi:hypothetical protein
MQKYCEYVLTDKNDCEVCALSGKTYPKFFSHISKNCCEKRAERIQNDETQTN